MDAYDAMSLHDRCHAEIAIVLAHALGRGGHELLGVGDLHGLERVEALVYAYGALSRRALEKVGFRRRPVPTLPPLSQLSPPDSPWVGVGEQPDEVPDKMC